MAEGRELVQIRSLVKKFVFMKKNENSRRGKLVRRLAEKGGSNTTTNTMHAPAASLESGGAGTPTTALPGVCELQGIKGVQSLPVTL